MKNEIPRDELHEAKREEMSSQYRAMLGAIPCMFGIHNWGPPIAANSVAFAGERKENGEWEHWVEDPSKTVTQYCQSCSKYRDREDLDWDLLAAIQRGSTQDPDK